MTTPSTIEAARLYYSRLDLYGTQDREVGLAIAMEEHASSLVAAAVRAETERCAALCENHSMTVAKHFKPDQSFAAAMCAKAIRSVKD